MPSVALPTAHWSEPPTVSNAARVALVPYLTTDGWWLYLGPADAIPSGAVRGAVVDDGAGGVTMETATTVGLRPTANLGGILFLMGST